MPTVDRHRVLSWPSDRGVPDGDAAAADGKALVRTFIVEDSEIILDNLSSALEEMACVQVVGHAPDESSAMQGLAQLGAGVDLVIVDVFLSSGSGLGVLRRCLQCGLAARRVVLTNYATPDMRLQCSALGADRVFDKSNELEELVAYCSRLADGHAGDAAVSEP